VNTIDETQAQLNTHEQVCAFRYESICARMKRLENIGMTATGTIIMLLIGILVSILIKGTP
jgi:cytochrome bd-type quinol oxidase subunit 2